MTQDREIGRLARVRLLRLSDLFDGEWLFELERGKPPLPNSRDGFDTPSISVILSRRSQAKVELFFVNQSVRVPFGENREAGENPARSRHCDERFVSSELRDRQAL